jgi:mRNA-degrading endonuclease toxin of MazEF toxin-antitoxin module
MATLEDVKVSLQNCQNTLQKHFDDIAGSDSADDEALKLRGEYFKWVNLKTALIGSEKDFILPRNALPNKVSDYVYNYLYQEKRDVVDKYYKKDSDTGDFTIHVTKKNVPQSDAEVLIHSLVLRRGNVVWVHLGFNVGSEFGGHHPALILKNAKRSLFVLPLSSQPPKYPDLNVKVDKVYGLPLMVRWGNVLRIVSVSILRVDFDSPIGSVKNHILNDVSEKIRLYGIK